MKWSKNQNTNPVRKEKRGLISNSFINTKIEKETQQTIEINQFIHQIA